MDPDSALAFDEAALLKRCQDGQGHALAALVERHQQRVFALASCLAGCDRDTAYQITVESFVEVLRVEAAVGDPPLFHRLLARVIEHSRAAASSPVFESPRVPGLSPQQQELLRLVRQSLLAMPFESRVPLLLRDQLGLPYEEIAVLVGRTPQQAKTDTLAARRQLREQLRETLDRLR